MIQKSITLYTLLLFHFVSPVHSQPVLNSNEMLPYGSLMVMKSIANLSVINFNIQGPGVTWNFSSITNNVSVPDLNVYIANPATTPYAAFFPNSNYGYREVTGTTTNYRYFDLTSTKMERVGSYVSSVNTYSDPQIEYVFPFQLGSINFDTWDNTNSSTGGTYDLECVGYGTLILPSGTFSNALLVKVHFIESFLDFYSYFWYSSDNGAILIQYIEGDGLFIPESGRYLSTLTVGIPENTILSDAFYNNPVLDNFNLNFKSELTTTYSWYIMNSIGQVVLNDEFNSVAGNSESLNIDFSNLSAGLYYFNIYSAGGEENPKSIRIIKQ